MEQANQYLNRYQQAITLEEKRAVVAEYQTFLETLNEAEREQARAVMQVLWPSIKLRVDELEPMMHSLEAMLNRLELSTNAEATVKA